MGPDTGKASQPSRQNFKGIMLWLWEPSKAIHDAESRQQARLLSALLLALFILLSVGLVANTIWRALNEEESTYVFATVTVFILLTYALSRTRYYYAAGILALLTLSFFPFGELLAYRHYENVGTTLMWLILPLLLSTVLLKLRDQALLIAANVLGLVILAIIGPQSAFYPLLVTAALILASSGIFIVLEIYRRRIENDRQSELVKSNRELEMIRASLEDQVAERTRNAEEARAEIEKANRALEMQMWQVSGLAELAKTMRGVQTIPSLTTSIIKQVCRYAKIPVGALFMTEGDELRLTASYGYPFPTNPRPRFKFGSGLVGEAARDRQVITLRDIPDNYLPITSGLGEATPAQILASPCTYQEQVMGVMELASLEPFTASQIQFLTSAMESIASALNTARIRTKIDTLLIETQQQAEELRAQEEEQRKVYLELDRREEDLQHMEQRLQNQQTRLDAIAAELKKNTAVSQDKMGTSDDD